MSSQSRRAADQFTYVSVHGHHHADVAIAMLVDLLGDPPIGGRARLDTPIGRPEARPRS